MIIIIIIIIIIIKTLFKEKTTFDKTTSTLDLTGLTVNGSAPIVRACIAIPVESVV